MVCILYLSPETEFNAENIPRVANEARLWKPGLREKTCQRSRMPSLGLSLWSAFYTYHPKLTEFNAENVETNPTFHHLTSAHLSIDSGIPACLDVYVSTRLVSIEFKVIYDSQMIYYGE